MILHRRGRARRAPAISRGEPLRELAGRGTRRRTSRRGASFSSAIPAWQSSSSPTARPARRARSPTCSRAPVDLDASPCRRRPRRRVAVDGDVAAGDAVLGVERHATALSRISRSSCSYASPICSSSASVSRACSSSIVREREADVDEHPVADLGLGAERDRDLAAHAGDLGLGEPASRRRARRSARGSLGTCRRSSALRPPPGRS